MKGKGKKESSKKSGSLAQPLMSKVCKWVKRIVVFFFVSTILVIFLYRFVPVYYTPLMFIRCFDQKMDGKEMHMDSRWVPITEISQSMVNAVIVAEDPLYLSHWGFDFYSIKRAAIRNLKNGKIVVGGSTISQQTAKNVFLWPDRSWVRKGFEVYFTVLIELLWNKERIMEVYLNIVELGDGIYGVEEASNHYFGKPARRLSSSQAALLAASLPNPFEYDPAHPSSLLYKREQIILKKMSYLGNVDLNAKE